MIQLPSNVFAAAAVSLTLCLTADPMAGQARYTIDDLMTVTSVSEFVWSPDGAGIYYLSDAGDTGTREIFYIGRAGGEARQITGTVLPELRTTPVAERAEPKGDLAIGVNGQRLFFSSARYFQSIDNLFSIRPDGSDLRQHTWHDGVLQTGAVPSPDGRTLAFYDRRSRGNKIYLLDLERPRAWPRQLAPGRETERNPVWSPDGQSILFTRSGDLWLQPVAGGEARRLAAAGYSSLGSPTWSPDGMRVAVTSGESGFTQLAVVEVATGELTPVTYAHREHASPSWSPDGQRLVFTMSDGLGISNQVATAPADGSAEPTALTRGQGIRSQPQYARDGGEIAYLETTSTRTTDVWAVPSRGGEPRQVTRSMGVVDPNRLAEAVEVTYLAEDNLPIPAVLLRPPGFDPSRKYPTVVALHGHPTQWNHSFNVFWQHMSQLGFVVIAPNPRGSVRMGQGFHDLHVGDYGGVEFDDVMRVVDYLRGQGYADMDRVATWGGSGGGYMQFVIATQAPEVFRAQIIRAPVSHWKTLAMERYVMPARHATPTREPQRAREEFGGSYAEIPDRYEERSPLNFVENVVVPQVLMHGLRDGSVPLNESRRWAERMRELGKDHLLEYVEYPDEDHSLTRYRATIRDRLERIQRFYGTHLRLPHLVTD
jgi:dipeptidyl aminopeptidase/acylaminoacyl peptidase